MGYWGKSVPGIVDKCKGSEAEVCSTCLKKNRNQPAGVKIVDMISE